MPSFSRGLEKALHQAMNLARERSHEFATLEHLLLALTDDRETIAVLAGCDVDVDALKGDLEDFINEEPGQSDRCQRPGRAPDGRISAGYSTRGYPCAILGSRGSDGCQCAGGYICRAGKPRSLFP
ncbi:Clp protease N-terminal domain-containing protein [Devosia algicola]|uniref:Clp protease N-terminal domain-containing protein n=1 Tax=Devosia algicola TaxID=3026418 RepID=UPI0038995BDD